MKTDGDGMQISLVDNDGDEELQRKISRNWREMETKQPEIGLDGTAFSDQNEKCDPDDHNTDAEFNALVTYGANMMGEHYLG